ncbi:MAG: DUF5131 family protein [Lachnospiraceae bacterium]|nr:DUF5131 family protein [Lachnospiraceae bacterium]
MGYRTKIDWCDTTWNPVTGCLHGCEYCYARGIAHRFGLPYAPRLGDPGMEGAAKWDSDEGMDTMLELEKPYIRDGVKQPYPMGFLPTFHRYRLDMPEKWSEPRVIFVCSMADLFGEWVPDEWIVEVLNACRRAPQHKYLFLTKNPRRYDDLEDKDLITDKDMNFWLGSTTAIVTQDLLHYNRALHTFQSCEPMLAPWPPAGAPNPRHMKNGEMPEWVIFGAETGNRKDKVVPEKEWVDNAVQMCRNIGAKVFMKESLREMMGADFIQEFPW